MSIAFSALIASEPDTTRPIVAVQWEAPPGCPSASEVRRAVEQLSGAEVIEAGDAAVSASAIVVREDEQFAASVEIDGEDGPHSRRLAADDCVLLGRAVAVVVAVALDPIAVAASMPTEPDPTPPAPAPASPPARTESPPPAPARRVAPSRPRRPLEYGGRLGLGVGGLVLPGVGAGLVAAPFIGVSFLHVRLTGQYWFPRSQPIAGTPNASSTIQLATVGVRVCPIPHWRRLRFPLCAGSDVGALIGEAEGANVNARGRVSSAWGAFVLQPGLEVAVTPRFAVWAAFEGAISYDRPAFHLVNGGQVHKAGRFEPRGLLGVSVHNRRTIPR